MPHCTGDIMRRKAICPAILGILLALGGTAAFADDLRIKVTDQHGAPLTNAVVTVSTVDPVRESATPAAEIAQVQQQFAPRVTVVNRGTNISFPNTDSTQHHVYSFSDAKQFEIELYRGDEVSPVLFDRSGIVALGCNIHDWMLGYVFVTDDPHFGVSNPDGVVSLAVSPADTDTLTAWHPAAGTPLQAAVRDLEAGSDGTLRVTLETAANDPLEFPVDPLQSLFGGDSP